MRARCLCLAFGMKEQLVSWTGGLWRLSAHPTLSTGVCFIPRDTLSPRALPAPCNQASSSDLYIHVVSDNSRANAHRIQGQKSHCLTSR